MESAQQDSLANMASSGPGILEQLQLENTELKRALTAVDSHLQTAVAEKEQIKALYADFKGHYEQMQS